MEAPSGIEPEYTDLQSVAPSPQVPKATPLAHVGQDGCAQNCALEASSERTSSRQLALADALLEEAERVADPRPLIAAARVLLSEAKHE